MFVTLGLRGRLRRALAIGAVVASTAAYAAYQIREHRMASLYAQAAGTSPSFGGTESAQAAVKELGTYKGSKSEQMLLTIAMGRTPFQWPSVQREAMIALASRHDRSISDALVNLLQPHYAPPVRQAAADALHDMPCSADCARIILHYLERVWQGEPNYEDRTSFPAGLNEGVKADVAKDQEALYRALFDVLRRESRSTLSTLVLVYGLGTDAPSKFSLTVVTRMRFHEACPLLLRSEELASQSSPDSFLAPRDELESTVKAVACR